MSKENIKEITLRDIQNAALEMLVEFVRVCNDNGLKYYISGGTYLGAVRHKGFIPWDDDVDVAMPRNDFNKLLELNSTCFKHNFKLIHYTKCQNVIHHCGKLERDDFQLIDHTASIPRKVNLWIDIFPLDGLPDNLVVRKIHEWRLLYLRGMFKLSLFDTIVNQSNKDRPIYENIVIFIAQHVKFDKVLSPYKRLRALDHALSKYDFYNSQYVMNFMGSYKLKSVMNKDKIYGHDTYYCFENYKFRGPQNYDEYLTQIYGDYMKLPPVEKRNWHQTTIVNDVGGANSN